MDEPRTRFPITPAAVRYIKLGTNNAWFPSCRANQRIEFGHRAVSHELALSGDRGAIAAVYVAAQRSAGPASSYAREVMEFYHEGADCLWITFAEGALWWGFSDPEVHMLEEETATHGQRYRTLLAPWSNTDANGRVLTISSLSTRLSQLMAYRGTICTVDADDYLVRRINGVPEPAVAEVTEMRSALLVAAQSLIAGLHWRDFEVLCDLIFSRSGWLRVGELGGLQKDTDLILQQVATGERAFVQIKSAADQRVFSDYVTRFEADPGYERMFFVCHSPKGALAAPSSKPVHLWAGETIAHQAVAAGLLDWLIEKAG